MTKVEQEMIVLFVPVDRPSIQSKVDSQVKNVQQEINAVLVTEDRSSIESKVNSQLTNI